MYDIININSDTAYADIVYSLEKECFTGDCWSKQIVTDNIKMHNCIQLVCFEDNVPIAYLDASIVLDEAELNRICVVPAYRSRGVSRLLIATLVELLHKNGIIKLMLEVRSHNIPAIFSYLSCGFSIDGIRKKYYNYPEDDAVLMTLHLR